jgi:hypothetical protein
MLKPCLSSSLITLQSTDSIQVTQLVRHGKVLLEMRGSQYYGQQKASTKYTRVKVLAVSPSGIPGWKKWL